VAHPLASGRSAWVHVAEGDISLNGHALSAGDSAAVAQESALELVGTKSAQVLVFDLN
jgi:hypothetical protein